MMLEEITKLYGMNDYLDANTGYIYKLSEAIDDGENNLLVPVIDTFGDNILLGYAKCISKQEE